VASLIVTMAATARITVDEDHVIVKLIAASKLSPVETVSESLTHLQHMFEGLNARYARHRELETHLIKLASEYREIHEKAIRYVDEMKEFSESAKDDYMPLLEKALNQQNLKMAECMLEDMSSHFDGVSVSFIEVVVKYEATARCIDEATMHAARLAKEAHSASESGESIKRKGVKATIVGRVLAVGGSIAAGTACVVAGPVVVPSAVVAGIGAAAYAAGRGAVAHGQNVTEEQDRQTAMFESFNDAMQKVNKIVMEHKMEVLYIQKSLKDLARNSSSLRRLVDKWAGDEGDETLLATYLKHITGNFTALEAKCDEFKQTDRNGFLRMAQALGYD